MSIASVNAVTTALPTRTPEPPGRPDREHDGDADDKGVKAATPQAAQSTSTAGAGGVVNTKA